MNPKKSDLKQDNSPYIESIDVFKLRHVNDFTINAEAVDQKGFQHIIITGKNGSGKTTFLDTIFSYLKGDQRQKNIDDKRINISNIRDRITNSQSQMNRKIEKEDQASKESRIRGLEDQIYGFEAKIKVFDKQLKELENEPALTVQFYGGKDDQPAIRYKYRTNEFILTYLQDNRSFSTSGVRPGQIDEKYEQTLINQLRDLNNFNIMNFSTFLENYLVNERIKMAFAIMNKDTQIVNEKQKWMDNFEMLLCELWNDDIRLLFDSENFKHKIIYSDGREVNFSQLPSGYSSILKIWSEIIISNYIRGKSLPNATNAGIVLIDEIENHLHLDLQRRVMGILTRLFPKIQFIVATHSPVIITSIENAVIYDLSSHSSVLSKELLGKNYSTLMTEILQIESDFDLATSLKLDELKKLHSNSNRTEIEQNRFENLLEELSEKSYLLALRIQNELLVKNNEKKNS